MFYIITDVNRAKLWNQTLTTCIQHAKFLVLICASSRCNKIKAAKATQYNTVYYTNTNAKTAAQAEI